jgi:CRP-like cAMP-binding protein
MTGGLQIYEKLLQFSFFQGMSRDDLELVAGHTRFGFTKVPQGKTVVKEGAACTHIYLLINGRIRIVSSSDDHSYTVEEEMQAPFVLQPDAIYGYSQRYTQTYVALTDANFITIDKDEVGRLSEDFLVFRINLLNIFATQAQKMARQPWRQCPKTLRERIIRFFVQHCAYPAGAKNFHILMNQLADELNDSRLNISRELNAMQYDGLLILHRGRIEIPSLEHMLMT